MSVKNVNVSSLKELVGSIFSECTAEEISIKEIYALCAECESKVNFKVDGDSVYEVLGDMECDRELTRCTIYGYDENEKMQYGIGYFVK